VEQSDVDTKRQSTKKEGIVDRIVTLLGVILGVLAVVFQLSGIAPGGVEYLQDGAIIAIGVGVITGR
jgi:hypothetical protein